MYKSDLNKIPDRAMTDKCIVLDLDETLVHSYTEDNSYDLETLKELRIFTDPENIDLRERTYKITIDDVVHKKGTGNKTEMWGILRPYAREFLIACFSYFKIVIVWSAGRKNYVHAIVDYLFKDIKRPIVVFTYDDIEKLPNGTLIKPLDKLIETVPGLKKYMSLENSFILDDRSSVFYEPNPYNGIIIPAYKPAFNLRSLRSDDIAFKQLIKWLMSPEVTNCKDVRTLDKSKIFEMSVTS
jgi:TFIIF-interacting CTD phosphatase-like protein